MLRSDAATWAELAVWRLLYVFLHHLGHLHGVIGDYTIDGRGDSSLAAFDGYRVNAAGGLKLDREIPGG